MRYLKFIAKKILPKKFVRRIKDHNLEKRGRKNEQQYRGDNVYCPCCRKRFGGFMDFPITECNDMRRFAETYQNTICPYCDSAPRHRIVCYYLEENKQVIPPNDILMFGAEFSIRKWFDRNGFHYRTADLLDQSADFIIDIQNIPFPDESWNIIICNHVLEHVPDYTVALKELKRVLRRGGFLELTVPTDRKLDTVYEDTSITTDEDRTKHFGQNDHLRIFGNDFEDILKECGFAVEVVDGSALPAEIVGVIGPSNYDDNRVYICRRS